MRDININLQINVAVSVDSEDDIENQIDEAISCWMENAVKANSSESRISEDGWIEWDYDQDEAIHEICWNEATA